MFQVVDNIPIIFPFKILQKKTWRQKFGKIFTIRITLTKREQILHPSKYYIDTQVDPRKRNLSNPLSNDYQEPLSISNTLNKLKRQRNNIMMLCQYQVTETFKCIKKDQKMSVL